MNEDILVLVAEDHLINQAVVTGLLKKGGFGCVVAHNGQEAVQLYKEHHPNLVLMDVQMPIMDGLDATREIRRIEAETGEHVPIIALTAFAMNEDMATCREAGMDDFMSKPISSDKFLQKLGLLVERLKGAA